MFCSRRSTENLLSCYSLQSPVSARRSLQHDLPQWVTHLFATLLTSHPPMERRAGRPKWVGHTKSHHAVWLQAIPTRQENRVCHASCICLIIDTCPYTVWCQRDTITQEHNYFAHLRNFQNHRTSTRVKFDGRATRCLLFAPFRLTVGAMITRSPSS